MFFITRRVGYTTFYWDVESGRFVPNVRSASLYESAYVAACVATALNANIERCTPQKEANT